MLKRYVYLVCEYTWDHHEVMSAWLTQQAAQDEADRLSAGPDARFYSYDVEEYRLNESRE